MFKIISILILLCFPIFIYIYFRKLKQSRPTVPDVIIKPIKQVVTFEKIEKENVLIKDQSNQLLADISTIIKRDNIYDVLITFTNNLGKHIRIDLEEITLYYNNQNNQLNGNFTFLDLTLGTNDYILKNTIIDGGNLIRNVHFTSNETIIFKGGDVIAIKLKVNNEPYEINTSINESTITEVKIISEEA